jgi:hypothetical protein
LAAILIFMLAWFWGAMAVKLQVVNYMLGFNLFACLAGALWLAQEEQAWGLASLGLLGALALLLEPGPRAPWWRWLNPEAMLALTVAVAGGLAWWAGLSRGPGLAIAWRRSVKTALLLLWAAALLPMAWRYLWHPPDPNQPIVALLKAHPAQVPGQALALERITESPWYYSLYAPRPLDPPPAALPACAAIWFDGQAWRFKPPTPSR